MFKRPEVRKMSIRALKTLLWIRDGRSFQETARELNMTLSL
jgi:hypothetical protein